MNTSLDSTLDIPRDATGDTRKAAEAVLSRLVTDGNVDTGGCTAFASPEIWADRGEQYGRNSVLIVIHDGGDLAPYFNHEHMSVNAMERMRKTLEANGFCPEQCTSWYSAIYKLNGK